jgi:hypothetical protein
LIEEEAIYVLEAGRIAGKIKGFEGFEALRKLIKSRCSAVGKVTGYGTDDLGGECR